MSNTPEKSSEKYKLVMAQDNFLSFFLNISIVNNTFMGKEKPHLFDLTDEIYKNY